MPQPCPMPSGRLPSVISSAGPTDSVSTIDLLSHDAPAITIERAAELVWEIYGLRGKIRPLTAEKDANFHIVLPLGEEALLKITNAAEDRDVTHMQTAALIHLNSVDPSLPVPHVCRALSGEASHIITEPTGQSHVVRLLTYLSGTVLSEVDGYSSLQRDIGSLLARLTRALRGFFHPAAGHLLQWDIKQAHNLRPMLTAVDDTDLRRQLTHLLDRFDAEIAPHLPLLRAQCVHNDFNPHNLLVDSSAPRHITGIIDFGDMVHTPIVCDLAVACSYQIADGPHPLDNIAKLIASYHSVLPLEEAEVELLPDLIRLRHATTLTIGAWRARRYPHNAAYILRNCTASRRGLNALDQFSISDVISVLHNAIRAS